MMRLSGSTVRVVIASKREFVDHTDCWKLPQHQDHQKNKE